MKRKQWLLTLLSGKPHFVIGGTDDPYLLRWYLLPRNQLLNIYLHKFLRDDDDSALHDHPWWFVSFMLKGSYDEVLRDERGMERFGLYRCPDCGTDQPPELGSCAHCGRRKWIAVRRRRFSLAFRRAEHRHRVLLHRDGGDRPMPCWTLVITGRKVRVWGFWCPKGFVPWHEFVAPGDHGSGGRGCGEDAVVPPEMMKMEGR